MICVGDASSVSRVRPGAVDAELTNRISRERRLVGGREVRKMIEDDL